MKSQEESSTMMEEFERSKKPKSPHKVPHADANDEDETTATVALKFLDHFFGDLTQPLHLCGRGIFG